MILVVVLMVNDATNSFQPVSKKDSGSEAKHKLRQLDKNDKLNA